jgi:hypothetical protein
MPLVAGYLPNDKYWNSLEILNMVRVLVNDAQGGLGGQILSDDRPYTWTLLVFCYSLLENWLEDNNVESATYAEAIVTIPANAGNGDPAAQSRLGDDGFTDASGYFYETPTLPEGFLQPLSLSVRTSGQNIPFLPMHQKLGGLGAQYAGDIYREWEYRQNSVYMIGCSPWPTDIKLRFIPSLPQLVQPTIDNPVPPTIWFARGGEALVYMIAAEYAEIRRAPNAQGLRMKANEQLKIIANKAAKRSNNADVRRRGYGFNRRGGRGYNYTVLG